jgi:hypothetical protein
LEFLPEPWASPIRQCSQLLAPTRAGGAQDGRDVELHGAGRDPEALRDRFVGQPAGRQAEHLALALREIEETPPAMAVRGLG